MSKLRKMVSWMLIAVMLLAANAFSCVFAEEVVAENPLASGVTPVEEDYKTAQKLSSIGLIETVEAEKIADYLTRGDMIGILTDYLEFGSLPSGTGTTPFLDVSAFDAQTGAYSALYKAGYITGDENKMYRPNDLLTYNEAVTFIVNAMGYKMFAVRNGGYPEGYLYTANKYGMLEGLRGSGNSPIPYCDLYRIIDSSLEADAVVQRVFDGNGNGDVQLQKGVSVLEELYGIKLLKGIVTGNENTRLYASGSERISRYQIEIENTVYDTPEQEYAFLLGRSVTAYAEKTDDGELEIIYLEEDAKKNQVFTLQAEDLLPEKSNTSAIYYEDEDSKERHIDVDSDNLTVIYNGKSFNTYGSIKNILPKNGYIEGLDNNGNDAVDVLFVYEYRNIVVGAVDRQNYKIYDKYTNEAILVDTEEDDVRIYDMDGNGKSIGSVMKDDVLTVMESANDDDYKLLIIYIQTETVDGTVDEVSDDKYLIGDTYYELADNLKAYIEAEKLGTIKAGVSGVFYLDRAGKIANYDRGEKLGLTYGFVAGVDTENDISSTIKLKIFTQDSEWLEIPTSQRVNIDGERIHVGTATGLADAKSRIPVGEVVLFTENNGEVTYIDTAAMNKGNYSKAADAGNLNLVAEGTSFTTRYGMCNEYGDLSKNKFMVNSNCIIFETPSRDELLEKMDEYAVVNSLVQYYYMPTTPGGYWQRVSDGYFAYNTFGQDINVASCLLLRGSNSGRSTSKVESGEYKVVVGNIGSVALTSRSQFGVVSKIASGMDEYGNERPKLYIEMNGTEKYALVGETIQYSKCVIYNYASNGVSFDKIGLEEGDVIQVGTNGDGYITQINVVYRANQEGEKAQDAWLTFPEFDLSYDQRRGEGAAVGIVNAVDTENRILQFAMSTEEDAKTYDVMTSVATVTIYDSKTKKSKTATPADLMKGDLVLVRTDVDYSARAAQVLVIR